MAHVAKTTKRVRAKPSRPLGRAAKERRTGGVATKPKPPSLKSLIAILDAMPPERELEIARANTRKLIGRDEL